MTYDVTVPYLIKGVTFNIHCFNMDQQNFIMQKCREFMVSSTPGQPACYYRLTSGSEVRMVRITDTVYNCYWKRREDLL